MPMEITGVSGYEPIARGQTEQPNRNQISSVNVDASNASVAANYSEKGTCLLLLMKLNLNPNMRM